MIDIEQNRGRPYVRHLYIHKKNKEFKNSLASLKLCQLDDWLMRFHTWVTGFIVAFGLRKRNYSI